MGFTYEAKNDYLVEELINDERYQVRTDGTIWRKAKDVWRQTGKAKTNKNDKIYNHLKYRGFNLVVHRIVYRKFNGQLDASLVINHKDGNSLNNNAVNLEQATHQENSYHAHAMHTY